MKKLLYFLLAANSLWLTACSINKQISKEANKAIFSDSNFLPAHVGISIYNPSTNKYLYNYQGDKYFVPASNTKLLTCYAAMKHLGDSLVGARYFADDSVRKWPWFFFKPTGDPTFLHPDFKNQRVFDLMQKKQYDLFVNYDNFGGRFSPLGKGWAWDDYNSDYMAERSMFPIAGNIITITPLRPIQKLDRTKWDMIDTFYSRKIYHLAAFPPYFDSVLNEAVADNFYTDFYDSLGNSKNPKIEIVRRKDRNEFIINEAKSSFKSSQIPFLTFPKQGYASITNELLASILKKPYLSIQNMQINKNGKEEFRFQELCFTILEGKEWQTIHSQPTDSLLKPMMHRSDNFFAEQSLLMVSNETLGYMSDTKIIDSLLQTDYKQMPQKPKWVDGSGLSRYNLITPQDFVFVLNRMKQDFAWERIATILPTGNEGTLVGLYKNHVGKIYAKTGTLSNNVALSGFITTNKGKQLIFSILVNNHQTSASNIRKAIEKFLVSIMDKN